MAGRSCVLLHFLVVLLAFRLVDGNPSEKQLPRTFKLTRGNITATFTDWGATIMSLVLPNRYGKLDDVLLGFDNATQYLDNPHHFGSSLGRFANRIKGHSFSLNRVVYNLTANEGNNTIHGGKIGLTKRFWSVSEFQEKSSSPSVVFSVYSPDGEEGFPGALHAHVNYTLSGDNQLSITMTAVSDKETPVSLAVHPYFRLGGHHERNILSEKIQIFASSYTPAGMDLVPNCTIASVRGTAFDFLQPRAVGSRIKDLPDFNRRGYDVNYGIDGGVRELRKVAVVYDELSGRVMELRSNAPGMQFYTGNSLLNVTGKRGEVYENYAGLALETLQYPNSVNCPNFPSPFVRPGQPYRHVMIFDFSNK